MKIKFFLFLSLFIIYLHTIYGQVVSTEPSIFSDTDPVTVIFYADQGTAGLKEYAGDIFAHTGVITNKSTSGSDWKYVIAEWSENTEKAKLTKTGNNTYELEISPSVRQFYQVPEDEEIQKLAFVFRNEDGSKEGKATGGSDIFVDLSQPGLAIKINSPQNNEIFDAGEEILIEISAQQNEQIELFIDNVRLNQVSGQELNYTFTANESKVYEIKAIATSDAESAESRVNIFIKGEIPEKQLPAGYRKGVEYLDDESVRLVLFAPGKEMVFVLGDFNNWQLSNNFIMNRDNDYFWLEITGLEKGKEYAYQYYIDNELYIADPYAEKILDPWNDKYIPEETYPNLKPYPEGKGVELVSVLQTGQDNYSWQIENFELSKITDLVIYELLIRDFTKGPEGKEGNINGVLGKLWYLKNLGVNAVELMPFNEFEGNNSWGYNPSFYFAPDKAYGTKHDYKKLIDSLHRNDLAVIMDIVLNHSYGQSPLVNMYFENGNPAENNPWYNVESPNKTYSWGYDFDHESLHTQEFVDSVLRFWLEEYKVDGFRFDFTKGFTNTPGEGHGYDADRIDILKRIADKVREYDEDALLILEHLADNSEEKELSEYGFLMWGNMNYNYAEASMGYNEAGKSDLSRGIYSTRNWDKPHLVTYMESHDEERIMYKNLKWGNSEGNYNITDLNTALERQELTALFFFTIPGPKMIWQFGELGYDINIDYNGRTGNKPVKWEYLNDYNRAKLQGVYTALMKLKIEQSAFETENYSFSLGGDLKKATLIHDDMNVVAIGNFGVTEKEFSFSFPNTGAWYDFFNHEEINITDTQQSAMLQPGEYYLYTTKEFEKPVLVSIDKKKKRPGNNYHISLINNPSTSHFNFQVQSYQQSTVELLVFDIGGKLVDMPFRNLDVMAGSQTIQYSCDLPKGMYLATFIFDSAIRTLKFIKY